jgi:outer membrane protein insertion porin family
MDTTKLLRGSRNILLASFLLSVNANALKVQKIEFDGLVHISPEIAKEIIGIEPGQNVSEEKINESIKALYKQRYFEDIWVEDKNGVLVYHVKEKPVIAKVDLKGYGNEEKNEEMLKASGLNKGDIYDKTKIKKIKQQISKRLEAEGYFDSTVEVKNEPINNGALKTDIVVKKGENVHIKDIRFIGAKNYGYSDFKPYLANKKEQTLGWFFGRDDGKLKADQLEYDALRVKEFYLKHGYLDVKVSKPFLKTNFDDYTANITYHIDEGPQYRVGKVDIKVQPDIIDAKKLKKELKLKSGKVFNVEKLRKDIATIKEALSDKGYAFAKVFPDVRQDRDKKVADVTYVIDPNQKVYVSNIVISGNSRTLDRVIRRELYLSEGEPFSQTDLKDSINALRRTGYFNDVQIIPSPVDRDHVNLLVKVNEASTGSIMGGISYGSYDGFGINLGLSDRNFLGTGIETGVNLDTSEKTVRGSLNFYNPRLFDSEYSLGGNIYRRKFDYYDYNEDSIGGSLKIGKKIGRHYHASLTYLYEDTELSNVSDSLLDSIYYQEGRIVKSSLIPSITFDNTDDYYLPRSGMNITGSVEYAGVGGDAKFIRTSLSAKYYYGFEDLIDYDLILRLKGKVSTINDRGNVPLNEKLYLGGMGTVRGFKYGTLAPRNEIGALVGAEKLAAASLELSIPLVESIQMRVLTFFDYGTTGNDSLNEIHRSSTGIGIEWAKSPLGVPLQISYAKALDAKEGDRTSKIEFSLGRRF